MCIKQNYSRIFSQAEFLQNHVGSKASLRNITRCRALWFNSAYDEAVSKEKATEQGRIFEG